MEPARKTWVKICGNTCLQDAEAAEAAGADAIGFVFTEGRRRVTPEQAATISAALAPRTEKIGVFVNESASDVLDAVRVAGLTGVQLQGEEEESTLLHLRHHGPESLKIIKTVSAEGGLEKQLKRLERSLQLADAVLVDSGSATLRGGTGRTFDWLLEVDSILLLEQHKPVVIAGGLTPENVTTAIALFRPSGVDVASGVETEPGKKDHARIRAFIRAVRNTEARPQP